VSKRNHHAQADDPAPAPSRPSFDVRGALHAAGEAYRRGHWGSAEQLCRAVLAVNDADHEALNLLGALLGRGGRLQESADVLARLVALDPGDAAARCNLGNVHWMLGRTTDAIEHYRRAVAIDADYAEAHNNLGVALMSLRRHDEAIAACERAIALRPRSPDAYYNRANALLDAGRNAEAAAGFGEVLALDPRYAGAQVGLGLAWLAQGRATDAADQFAQVVAREPAHVDALLGLADALRAQQRPAEALAVLDRAAAVAPDHADAHYRRANVLTDLGRLDEALQGHERALALRPAHAETHNNRGNVLRDLRRHDEALASYDLALAYAPESAEIHTNRANALVDLHRFAEAHASYDRALALAPEFAPAHLHRGMALLAQGDLLRGFTGYEWRLRAESAAYRVADARAPTWTGREDIEGRTVLLRSEQGFGDALQFSRYAPMVAARGARVLLEVERPLAPLLVSLANTAIVVRGEPLPAVDFQVPLLSLPRIFGTTLADVPAEVPYLQAPSDRVAALAARLGPARKPRIGIAWRGRATHRNDRNRSVPPAALLRLASDAAEWFSLQPDVQGDDAAVLAAHPGLTALGGQLRDFADTAALVAQLDLVLTVDTSVAHLAGALGKPVWLLLPFNADWRWLLARGDSPWYPSARLFRQRRLGDWDTVLADVAQALNERFPGWPAVSLSSPPASMQDAEDASPAPAARARASGAEDEAQRRKATIAARKTDVARWRDARQLEASWEPRARRAADWLPQGAAIHDVGCGAMLLERYLPANARYVPSDVVARDARTLPCDLNAGRLPDGIAGADRVVMLGVLEYLFDLRAVLTELRRLGRTLLCSYCCADYTQALDREALGWVNHLSSQSLSALFRDCGFRVQARERIDANQDLYVLVPGEDAAAERRVVVLSYHNAGNFGDRLGYHGICAALPPNARVEFVTHRPWSEVHGDIDLLVVGIGNSLYRQVLTPELLALVERARHAVGIFGTQYRDAIERPVMQRLLRGLDRWYARYEEDALLFGTECRDTVVMGDWLIDSFAMTRGTDDALLRIGAEVLEDAPLDRTIQRIQRHRHVFSERLHPLLCALTSAETVGYLEQRESGTPAASGKFASLLRDVFGRPFPEASQWDVDRADVVAYKEKVRANVGRLRNTLHTILE
jgi:tetratricopeptide (TPR) repeat protein